MNETTYIVSVATVSVIAFGISLQFIRRLIELRHERLLRTPPEAFRDLPQRLERIENAVETTALEVERIAEANRFIAKLLAERGSAVPLPPKSERVITPH